MQKEIMVTVVITAYNHEKYIEDAILGVLNQKTEYNYELIVHDDASTDNTVNIIKEYEKKYPRKIQSILQKENLFSKGLLGQVVWSSDIKGKYLAICDGDDYWVDEQKLQKQISYLESHPECSMCFHNAIAYNCVTGEKRTLNTFPEDGVYGQEDQILAGLGSNFPASASYVMRTKLYKEMPDFFVKTQAIDYTIRQYMACMGSVYYFHAPMSVYRVMSSHSYMKETAKSRSFYNSYTLEMLKFFEKFKEFTNGKFNKIMNCKIDSDYYGFCSSIEENEGIEKAAENGLDVPKIKKCYHQLDEKYIAPVIESVSNSSENLFIYGTSRLSTVCKAQLEYAGIEYKGFVVSSGQMHLDDIEGKKVFSLNEVIQEFNHTGFILAVQPVNLAVIEKNLLNNGIKNYCTPYILEEKGA